MGLLLDLLVLLPSAVVVGLIMAGAVIGAMYLVHKHMADKLPDTNFGAFNFDNFQKRDFIDMMTQLLLIILTPTVLLHVIEYVILGMSIRRYPMLVCSILTVLELTVLFIGFHKVMKLEPLRAGILTAAAGLLYILLLATFLYYKIS